MTPEPFGDRLLAALATRVPMCVGIDPHKQLLEAWGLRDDVAGLESFARTCIDAFAGQVAVLKPQSAFFERHGAAGVAVLERTMAAARAAGALVILDAKRGDIGSTAAAYADAYLEQDSAMFCDALTVSPYLGFGSMRPFIDAAQRNGAGIFVLAETSNPEGPEVQRAVAADGATVAQHIVNQAAEVNAQFLDGRNSTLGSIGVVIGGTITTGGADVRRLRGPILAPGFGAQGATAADLAHLFPSECTVIASTSRDILSAGPERGALRERVRTVGSQLAEQWGF